MIGIPIGITSSAIGLKLCAVTAGIKKYKSITKKKKKHDKIVLLAKSKLNSIEVLISKTLIDSNLSHNEFVLINNVLKEYDKTKEKIKNLKKCRKNTESKNPKVIRTKNGRIMLVSKYAVCDGKKSKFIKEQEASGL